MYARRRKKGKRSGNNRGKRKAVCEGMRAGNKQEGGKETERWKKKETQATQGECLNHTGIAVSMAAGRAKRLANRNAPEISLGTYTSEQVNQLDVIGNNEQYLFF